MLFKHGFKPSQISISAYQLAEYQNTRYQGRRWKGSFFTDLLRY
jgi:hypothetical protein